MVLNPHRYHLPATRDVERLLSRFDGLGSLRLEPRITVQRTFFDSFDRRLYTAGSLMIQDRQPDQIRTRWLRLSDGGLLGQFMHATPRFCREIPGGPLQQKLQKLLGVRALLALAVIDVELHRASVINTQGKTVLRLTIEQTIAGDAGPPTDRLPPPQLHLIPVRGYPKPLRQAVQIVSQIPGAAPVAPQREPRIDDNDGGPPVTQNDPFSALNPEMPAGEALCHILLHLLQTMRLNLEGTRADLDTEFLHDFRVAVRRTRSLISQIKSVFPAGKRRNFQSEFKWLGQLTGPTRDLDVYLLRLADDCNALPETMREALTPLRKTLEKRRLQQQRKMSRQLASNRCLRLFDSWQAFLESGIDPACWPPRAYQPIAVIANRRISQTWQAVLAEGSSITDDSPAESLHALRITCKKLRYLMEFFHSLYPPKKIRTLIRTVKSLQENLGNFHDLEIQAEALRALARPPRQEPESLPGETLLVMGVLIDLLDQRQATERQQFSKRFVRFSQPANRALSKALFKPPVRNEVSP